MGQSNELRYVAIGDSYTIGTGVELAERWPDQLVARLRGAGAGAPPGTDEPHESARGVRLVANLAVNGATSEAVLRDQVPALAALRPELVSVLVGVNDVVRDVPPALHEQRVAEILDALIQPGRRVFAVTIPDYTVTPAGAEYGDPLARSAAIRAANATLARLTAERRIPLVDVHDVSLLAAGHPSLVAADGLHPSGSQYARWVDRIEPVVRALLADRSSRRP